MVINVIIDTPDNSLADFLSARLKEQIYDLQFISYQDITDFTIIFKEITSLSDLKELSIKKYPFHSIVIITDNQELMFLSLDLYPLTFIRKSQLDEDLAKTVALILSINQNIEQILTFKIGHSYIQIKVSQIIWIESFGHYLFIHTKTGHYKVREKIGSILEKMNPAKFSRVHKSYIINKDYILQTHANEIELTNHQIIPVGRKFK